MRPFSSTNVAKLMLTSASHVIASLSFLYDKFATCALPVVKIALEKINLMLIT
jgi:hypothetical protein